MNGQLQAGGTLRPSALYIEREADRILLEKLLEGTYANILAPRQVGKTSLALRTSQRLADRGCRSAFVDLTSIGSEGVSAEAWFNSFVDVVEQNLKQKGASGRSWEDANPRTPVHRLRRFLEAQVENPADGPLVIFVDEIDVVQRLPFADDFFSAVRSIFNEAPSNPICGRLVFCLIGVSVPLDLTQDPRQTPYNIGFEIALPDFRREQLAPMAERLDGLGADPQALMDAIYDWTHGHPALTQYLCKLLRDQGTRSDDARARVDDLVRGNFLTPLPRDTRVLLHIENYFRLTGRQANLMLGLYRRVLLGEPVVVQHISPVHIGARRAGLVAEEEVDGKYVLKPRNRIFREVFNLSWVEGHMQRHEFAELLTRWTTNGRHERDLMNKQQIQRFEAWVKQFEELGPEERDFLLASKTRLERRYRSGIIAAWGLVAVLVCLLGVITHYVIRYLSRANDSVLDLKHDLERVGGDYESMERYPDRRTHVMKEAPRIGQRLLQVEDARITGVMYRIVKYEYAAYAFTMAASAHALSEGEHEQTITYANRAIDAANRGLERFEKARGSKLDDDQAAYAWTVEDDGHNRMRYLLAMALSLRGQATGDESLRDQALQALSQVEPKYRQRSKPMQTRELRWICPAERPPAVCEPDAR